MGTVYSVMPFVTYRIPQFWKKPILRSIFGRLQFGSAVDDVTFYQQKILSFCNRTEEEMEEQLLYDIYDSKTHQNFIALVAFIHAGAPEIYKAHDVTQSELDLFQHALCYDVALKHGVAAAVVEVVYRYRELRKKRQKNWCLSNRLNQDTLEAILQKVKAIEKTLESKGKEIDTSVIDIPYFKNRIAAVYGDPSHLVSHCGHGIYTNENKRLLALKGVIGVAPMFAFVTKIKEDNSASLLLKLEADCISEPAQKRLQECAATHDVKSRDFALNSAAYAMKEDWLLAHCEKTIRKSGMARVVRLSESRQLRLFYCDEACAVECEKYIRNIQEEEVHKDFVAFNKASNAPLLDVVMGAGGRIYDVETASERISHYVWVTADSRENRERITDETDLYYIQDDIEDYMYGFRRFSKAMTFDTNLNPFLGKVKFDKKIEAELAPQILGTRDVPFTLRNLQVSSHEQLRVAIGYDIKLSKFASKTATTITFLNKQDRNTAYDILGSNEFMINDFYYQVKKDDKKPCLELESLDADLDIDVVSKEIKNRLPLEIVSFSNEDHLFLQTRYDLKSLNWSVKDKTYDFSDGIIAPDVWIEWMEGKTYKDVSATCLQEGIDDVMACYNGFKDGVEIRFRGGNLSVSTTPNSLSTVVACHKKSVGYDVTLDLVRFWVSLTEEGRRMSKKICVSTAESCKFIKLRSNADPDELKKNKDYLRQIFSTEKVFVSNTMTSFFTCNSKKNLLQFAAENNVIMQVNEVENSIIICGPSCLRDTAKLMLELQFMSLEERVFEFHHASVIDFVHMTSPPKIKSLLHRCGCADIVIGEELRLVAYGDNHSLNALEKLLPVCKRVDDVENKSDLCSVCLCDVDDEQIRLSNCSHIYCSSCLHQMVVSALDARQIPVLCAHASCALPLALRDMAQWRDNGELLKAAVLSRTPELFFHCPTTDCSGIFLHTKHSATVKCEKCDVTWCTQCHEKDHAGVNCSLRDALAKVEERMRIWLSEKPKNRKLCPKCHSGIEKNGGCNRMLCIQCNTVICWLCLRMFVESGDCYEHLDTEHPDDGYDDDYDESDNELDDEE